MGLLCDNLLKICFHSKFKLLNEYLFESCNVVLFIEYQHGLLVIYSFFTASAISLFIVLSLGALDNIEAISTLLISG